MVSLERAISHLEFKLDTISLVKLLLGYGSPISLVDGVTNFDGRRGVEVAMSEEVRDLLLRAHPRTHPVASGQSTDVTRRLACAVQGSIGRIRRTREFESRGCPMARISAGRIQRSLSPWIFS
jgi:hypothetical protein